MAILYVNVLTLRHKGNLMLMKYLLQLVVLLSVFLTSMLSTAAIHDGAVEIRSENGSQVIGYVHEFLPFDLNVRQDTPIVFIPGFDIPGLGDNERELPPGERDKGFRLLRSLSQSNELFDEEPERAIELLADQHGFRVFVVESVDNNQSVAKNSLIVERYLTAGETGPFQTYMRNGTRGVVIGFSMGGIIARHALTKLEFENRDHHTSLYVSMDAPHRGAFLPSSLELVTRTLNGAAQKKIIGEIFKGENLDQRLEDGVEALNSEAARELLGLYIGFRAEDFQTPARLQAIEADYMQAAHPSHHTLRNSILLMGGHPTSLRSVAFANGSINGFPLHNREAQGRQDGFLMLNVPIKFNSPTAPDEELISIKFFNDATLQRRTPCRVRVLADTDRCPNFRLPSELHDVTAAPGSFTTGLREVDETIDSTADITVPFDIRLVLDTITLSLDI